MWSKECNDFSLFYLFIFLKKFFEVEDAIEGEKKELQDKVESLESIVRMLELKAKNSADHGKFNWDYYSEINLHILSLFNIQIKYFLQFIY